MCGLLVCYLQLLLLFNEYVLVSYHNNNNCICGMWMIPFLWEFDDIEIAGLKRCFDSKFEVKDLVPYVISWAWKLDRGEESQIYRESMS